MLKYLFYTNRQICIFYGPLDSESYETSFVEVNNFTRYKAKSKFGEFLAALVNLFLMRWIQCTYKKLECKIQLC